MPRTEIPITDIIRAGATEPAATFADITNNHYFANNDQKMFVIMANVSNASTVNMTFETPALFDGDLSIADVIVALAPGAVKLAGPWRSRVFDQSDGSVYMNVGSTGISFRGYRLQL